MGTGSAAQNAQNAGKSGLDVLMNNPFVSFFLKLVLAVFVFVVLILISEILTGIIKKKIIEKSSIDDNDENAVKMGSLIGDLMFYILVIFSLTIGFQIIGFNFSWILGGLSVGIGFAFKEVLGNTVAGILLLASQDLKFGDKISYEDWNLSGRSKYFGRIEKITLRYTVLRTQDNTRIIVPNLSLTNSPIETYTAEDFVRYETFFRVGYKEDLGKVIPILKDAINSLELVRNKEKTQVIEDEDRDYSYNGVRLRVLYWVNPNEYSIVECRGMVHKAMIQVCKDNGIDLPYPHTAITLDKNDNNFLKSVLFLLKKNKEDN